MKRSAPLLHSGEGLSVTSTRTSSSDNRPGNDTPTVLLAKNCGASFNDVHSGLTRVSRERSSGFDGRNDSGAPQISRGPVKGRCSADTLVPMSERACPDPSKYGTNPLAPNMTAPSYESTAMLSRDRSNPLPMGLGSANNWSRRGSEVSSGYAPSCGLDGVITNTGTRDFQPGSQRQSLESHIVTASEAGGSKTNQRRPCRTSSSDSPSLSQNSGDDFTTRLERIPLLDDGPTLRKSAQYPWPPTRAKHSVREIAARLEKVAKDSLAPQSKHSLSLGRGGTSSSSRSVSCPVEGWSPEKAIRAARDNLFLVGHGNEATMDRASGRAWDQLTIALEYLPPDDLAMLQEILSNQANLSRSEGPEGRSDMRGRKGNGADSRPNGVSGSRQLTPGRVENDEWRRSVEELGDFKEVYKRWRDRRDQGDGGIVNSGEMQLPRCRCCGRVDARFEEEWMAVYKDLAGVREQALIEELEEELEEGAMGESKGFGVERRVGGSKRQG